VANYVFTVLVSVSHPTQTITSMNEATSNRLLRENSRNWLLSVQTRKGDKTDGP